MGDLLESCKALATELQSFHALVRAASVLIGLAFVGTGLYGLHSHGQGRGRGRGVLPSLARVVVGVLLCCFTSVVDALSLAVFRESAPRDFSSVTVGQAGGLEPMVGLALTVVMLVGVYQILKGFVMLRESAAGHRLFWPAVTHIFGGVLCVNMRTFMLALGNTLGGSFREVVGTLLGG